MNCGHETSACQAGRMAALPARPILARACAPDTALRLAAKRPEAQSAMRFATPTHEHTSPERDFVRARARVRIDLLRGTEQTTKEMRR